MSSDDESAKGSGVPLIEPLSPSPEPATSKRKAVTLDDRPISKRAAKRKKTTSGAQNLDDDGYDLEAGLNLTIAHMDGQLMADHLAQRIKRFQSDLSLVELEDLRIPASIIADTTSFSKPRTSENLASFLEHYAQASKGGKNKSQLSQASKEKGCPHTIIVAAAGLRAADLTRAVRRFQTKECAVAKLFAKHIKLKEAVETVSRTRMGIGVGTPQRLIDLLDNGALKTKSLQRIVIDASHIDAKKRGILDMRETHTPLVTLLNRKEIKDRLETGDESLLLFY